MTAPEPTYTVIHQDTTLMVVCKASGVLTVSRPGSRERCLLDDLRRDRFAVSPVHRLDRDTSGALLLCLDPAHRRQLEQLFRRHEVIKEYLALVRGVPPSARARIDVPILDQGRTARVDRAGRRAVTRYTVVERLTGAALVRVRMDTGRHNQIRVHMAHIGHALVGDDKFGRRREAGPQAARAMLHAARLVFVHPATGNRLDLRVPAPEDFEACLKKLRAPLSRGP